MKISRFFIAVFVTATAIGCSKGPVAPPPVTGGNGGENTWPPDFAEPSDPAEVLVLPDHSGEELYSVSPNPKPYYPVSTKYSTNHLPSGYKNAKARILPYLIGFDYECTRAEYVKRTNKYGSRTDMGPYESTGRFYVKKIGDRFYLIDPYGYPHIQRGVASLRQGSSARNAAAFNEKFKNVSDWLQYSAEELAKMGMHGSGAFCTGTYQDIQEHNRFNKNTPLTLSPSFGFLSSFKNKYGLSYCNGNSNTAIGMVMNENWEKFCEEYCREALVPYLNDPNVLGIFSDNEIDFGQNSGPNGMLKRILDSKNSEDPAYQAAKKLMSENGTATVTQELNMKFVGMLAERYYKGVKEGIQKADRYMLYLGTRLHGSPKYIQSVVAAAGKYCDVISINYYARWDVELNTRVQDWAKWAPDTPFMVTEFYTKAEEATEDAGGITNLSGAGFLVPTHKEKAFAYQHFTLGLLEAKNCVGWHWFKYQDDDGQDNDAKPANKGIFDNYYEVYPWMGKYVRDLNYNTYKLIDFFDGK